MLGLHFCARAFSSCGKWGPLFIAVRGPLLLRSTGSRCAGSVIVAHGPSCSTACGIFPDQGLNPCPLHWQADSQPLRHQGSPMWACLRPVVCSVSLGAGLSAVSWWWSRPCTFVWQVPTEVMLVLPRAHDVDRTCDVLLHVLLPWCQPWPDLDQGRGGGFRILSFPSCSIFHERHVETEYPVTPTTLTR